MTWGSARKILLGAVSEKMGGGELETVDLENSKEGKR